MEQPLRLIVVSASPIFSRALEGLIIGGPLECRTQSLHGAELAEPTGTADLDLAVVAPQNWQELAGWLHPLRRNLAHLPWLLLADPRLIGMFLCSLQDKHCALVAPGAPTEELWTAAQSLVDRQYTCLHDELLVTFVQGASANYSNRRLRLPSPQELQCGCAVSLGLSNRQIAETLHLQEVTVKSHLYRLMRKLNLPSRYHLAALFNQALALPAATFSRH
jgi:DNA-binding NarL/FixJ family response regulator